MEAVDWQAVEAAIGRLEADWTDALGRVLRDSLRGRPRG